MLTINWKTSCTTWSHRSHTTLAINSFIHSFEKKVIWLRPFGKVATRPQYPGSYFHWGQHQCGKLQLCSVCIWGRDRPPRHPRNALFHPHAYTKKQRTPDSNMLNTLHISQVVQFLTPFRHCTPLSKFIESFSFFLFTPNFIPASILLRRVC